jgi:hypothetical protein
MIAALQHDSLREKQKKAKSQKTKRDEMKKDQGITAYRLFFPTIFAPIRWRLTD